MPQNVNTRISEKGVDTDSDPCILGTSKRGDNEMNIFSHMWVVGAVMNSVLAVRVDEATFALVLSVSAGIGFACYIDNIVKAVKK